MERELEFEQKLRSALRHRAAPLGLKQRVLREAAGRRGGEGGRGWLLQRLAAAMVLAALCGGVATYHHEEQQRKGEEAREQVMTALWITNKTLNRVGDRLAEDSR